MTTPLPVQPVWRQRLLWLIAFVLAVDVAFFFQRIGGAYRSEFGGHPEEASHVMTGLFVRDGIVFGLDWWLQGSHGSPTEAGKDFAKIYRAHYPNIGLGEWPPFFYVVQSAWTLPIPPSRASLLLFMAALAGGVAVLLAGALRGEYGRRSAAGAAVLLLALPLMRQSYVVVMPEVLGALLMFGAMLAVGRFLDGGEQDWALWFGVLAALAILTQAGGLALLLAAPLALLGARRFQLVGRPALWGAMLIVAGLVGLWIWVARHLGWAVGPHASSSWSFSREALPYYVTHLGQALGWVLLPLMLIGLWAKLGQSGSHRGRWAAAGALLVSVVLFDSFAPARLETRHLIAALPPALMFATAGAHWLGERLKSRLLVPILGVLALASIVRPVTPKGYTGFSPIVVEAMHEAGPAETTLVSSDSAGEGILISSFALRERRPGHVVRQASRDLARPASKDGNQLAFARDEELLAHLITGDEVAYRYLILDDALPLPERRPHHDQLKRLVEEYPQHFEILARSEVTRAGVPQAAPIQLYKIHRKN